LLRARCTPAKSASTIDNPSLQSNLSSYMRIFQKQIFVSAYIAETLNFSYRRFGISSLCEISIQSTPFKDKNDYFA
jgi:2C-methyl-D-erythritol 2,4-cyclodiphosphate synthase